MTRKELTNIDNVEPLGEHDHVIIGEIRAILEKHGALQRFGVTLLHSHFKVADDEILVETVDKRARKLTVQPISAAEVEHYGTPIETSWRLDSPDGKPTCLTYCFRAPNGDFHLT